MILASVLVTTLGSADDSRKGIFVMHVKSEPQSMDPSLAISGASQYLHASLFRGLMKYDSKMELKPELASTCKYKGELEVRCTLKKQLKYHDGKFILASDFVRTFQNLMASKASYLNALISHLSSVSAVANESEVVFKFKSYDSEFLEKLSHPLLTPTSETERYSGPYQIEEKVPGKHWRLKSNPHYYVKKSRPEIKVLFVSEDSAALNLYEKGLLDFNWRIIATDVEKYKDKKDLMLVPVLRFDYIGFNLRQGKPLENKSLRQTLTSSIEFDYFKKMFFSPGRPGCTGLSLKLVGEQNNEICQKFKKSENLKGEGLLPLELKYSSLAGDDVRRSLVWFQQQWLKNSGIKVNLLEKEHKALLQELKTDAPDIFRKGIALSRPTCLAAVETFKSDHPENFTGVSSPVLDSWIDKLSTTKMNATRKKALCRQIVTWLFIKESVGIPLGEEHFTMLLKPKFKGLKINQLNQLDLADLEEVP